MKVVLELHHFTTAEYLKALIKLQCKTVQVVSICADEISPREF